MNITIEAISPICHGEFSDGVDKGNITEFRRIPIIKEDKIYDVPVISGNSIRGVLRRELARELVDKYDLINVLGKDFDKFYIAIANGGNINKNLDASVNTEQIRQLRESLPILSVLGSAMYRYMVNGMVNIGFAIPQCAELHTGVTRILDLTSDIGLTRHIDNNIVNPEDCKPMPYTVEVINSGVVFDMNMSFAPQATEVEKSCIYHGLSLIRNIGGKVAVGFGRVKVSGIGDGSGYLSWLDNQEKNVEIIKNIAKDL